MTQPRTKPTLAKRMLAVLKAVPYLQKDSTVQLKKDGKKIGEYAVITHDAVTALVRPHLVKHGIIVAVSMYSLTTEDVARGSTLATRATVEMVITFINADDGEDNFCVTSWGIADDYGDKAVGKACSYAVKYAYLKTFLIETGEDEEQRVVTDDVPMDAKQLTTLLGLMEETTTNEEQYLEYLLTRHKIEAKALAEIPKRQYSLALGALQAKKAKL